jgi:hypothetical protein
MEVEIAVASSQFLSEDLWHLHFFTTIPKFHTKTSPSEEVFAAFFFSCHARRAQAQSEWILLDFEFECVSAFFLVFERVRIGYDSN